MSIVNLTFNVEVDEVPEALDELRGVIRRLALPAYAIKVDADPEAADESDDDIAVDVERPHCGDLVEINGFEYVVVTENLEGNLELALRDETGHSDETDHFLSRH